MWRNWNHPHAVGMQHGAATLEDSLAVPQWTMQNKHMTHPFHPPVYAQEKWKHRCNGQKLVREHRITAVLSVTITKQRLPKCPSADEWMNKIRYLHKTGQYSALKRNKLLIHATT